MKSRNAALPLDVFFCSFKRVFFTQLVDGQLWAVGRRNSAHTFICTPCQCGGVRTIVINSTFHVNHPVICEDCREEGVEVPEVVFDRVLSLLG